MRRKGEDAVVTDTLPEQTHPFVKDMCELRISESALTQKRQSGRGPTNLC